MYMHRVRAAVHKVQQIAAGVHARAQPVVNFVVGYKSYVIGVITLLYFIYYLLRQNQEFFQSTVDENGEIVAKSQCMGVAKSLGEYSDVMFYNIFVCICNYLGSTVPQIVQPPEIYYTNLHNQGFVQLKSDDYAGAVEYFQQAIKEKERRYGRNNLTVAITLHPLGVAYFNLKEYKMAEQCFLRAKKIQTYNNRVVSKDMADLLYNLSLLYRELGCCKMAKQYLNNATSIYNLIAPTSLDFSIDKMIANAGGCELRWLIYGKLLRQTPTFYDCD